MDSITSKEDLPDTLVRASKVSGHGYRENVTFETNVGQSIEKSLTQVRNLPDGATPSDGHVGGTTPHVPVGQAHCHGHYRSFRFNSNFRTPGCIRAHTMGIS